MTFFPAFGRIFSGLFIAGNIKRHNICLMHAVLRALSTIWLMRCIHQKMSSVVAHTRHTHTETKTEIRLFLIDYKTNEVSCCRFEQMVRLWWHALFVYVVHHHYPLCTFLKNFNLSLERRHDINSNFANKHPLYYMACRTPISHKETFIIKRMRILK